ncbi:MAG TPA: FixH family protein [Polyangiaceae bacterium]|jgi:hypothetical protein|nr:FixH family protein [Polyangiaceae bacterium]
MADKNRLRTIAAAAFASAVGVVACSSSSGGDGTGTSAGAATSVGPSTPTTFAENCPTWSGALDAYGGGVDVVHEGVSNHFNFRLSKIEPAPPALGTLTWSLAITDMSGQPVKDATFTKIYPYMPQHGHSSTAQATATSNGDGTYTINELYLYMAGVWQVTFYAQSGTTTDNAMFAFCLGS